MQKNKVAIIVGVACIVVGFIGGFLIGRSSGISRTAENFGQNGSRQFARMGGQNGSTVAGEVSAVDGNSITVILRNGGSNIVFYSTSTPVAKSVEASSSDIAIGQQVIIAGTSNSDGSITANSIQIRSAAPMPGSGQ